MQKVMNLVALKCRNKSNTATRSMTQNYFSRCVVRQFHIAIIIIMVIIIMMHKCESRHVWPTVGAAKEKQRMVHLKKPQRSQSAKRRRTSETVEAC